MTNFIGTILGFATGGEIFIYAVIALVIAVIVWAFLKAIGVIGKKNTEEGNDGSIFNRDTLPAADSTAALAGTPYDGFTPNTGGREPHYQTRSDVDDEDEDDSQPANGLLDEVEDEDESLDPATSALFSAGSALGDEENTDPDSAADEAEYNAGGAETEGNLDEVIDESETAAANNDEDALASELANSGNIFPFAASQVTSEESPESAPADEDEPDEAIHDTADSTVVDEETPAEPASDEQSDDDGDREAAFDAGKTLDDEEFADLSAPVAEETPAAEQTLGDEDVASTFEEEPEAVAETSAPASVESTSANDSSSTESTPSETVASNDD